MRGSSGGGHGGGSAEDGGQQPLSQHPVDRLIRELIDTGREATTLEIDEIVERIATAPFDPRMVAVKLLHRGRDYGGQTLGARADSLVYHLVQRVVVDNQWAHGTTAARYLADLRAAARDSQAGLALYARRGGHVAATLTPTARVLPLRRRGLRPLPEVLVIFSADRGIIVTGYQFSELARTGIPQEARWLKPQRPPVAGRRRGHDSTARP